MGSGAVAGVLEIWQPCHPVGLEVLLMWVLLILNFLEWFFTLVFMAIRPHEEIAENER